MMQSRTSPAPVMTSCRSSNANWPVTWLMRTTRVLPCQSCVRSASTTLARAAGFSSGAHASSRSRKTSSAALDAAFSIIRGLLPGTARTERRRRAADTARLVRLRGRPIVVGSRTVLRRSLAVVRRVGPVVGWDIGALRRQTADAAHPAEETAEHLLELLGAAQVVLDALEHASHQLLELRILGQLFLEAAELVHQLLHLHLLRHLHQHRLRSRRGDHLHLLADHLEPLAGHAGALVLAPAQLGFELVELRVDPTQVYAGLRRVAHAVIVVDARVHTANVASRPGSGIVIR